MSQKCPYCDTHLFFEDYLKTIQRIESDRTWQKQNDKAFDYVMENMYDEVKERVFEQEAENTHE